MVELTSLFQDLIFKMLFRVEPRLLNELIATKVNVDIDCLFDQIHVYQLFLAFPCDRIKHCTGDARYEWLEDIALEELESLLRQGGQRIDFYVEAIQILKESLHPADHDAMVRPLVLEGFKEDFTVLTVSFILLCKPLQLGQHLACQVTFDGLCVLLIQSLLNIFMLQSA
jgi:hypothetical protein